MSGENLDVVGARSTRSTERSSRVLLVARGGLAAVAAERPKYGGEGAARAPI